ncbi:hypothetical protein LPB86_18145 [Pedobacter sp. MC2016-14]|uniref:hypothetical protein n=1 Tax=Pedobacter sp. MC2016-14 TaxID=2897327 RepID=UPI001E3C70FD|nr:hypothetical protein [Pedobacter sp. MC2016-14]MCD0490168.1 hypothetical protein [Pedobacter sp. MC2016-14]
MEIKEYIESGILEAYIFGSVSEAEADELLSLKEQYPEVKNALHYLERDIEIMAQHMAIIPPSGTWSKIEDGINELMKAKESISVMEFPAKQKSNYKSSKNSGDYIEVEGPSTHMRIHKAWRWIFGAIFLLGKIFLAFAIYFYLESRQAKEQIRELKIEFKEHKNR